MHCAIVQIEQDVLKVSIIIEGVTETVHKIFDINGTARFFNSRTEGAIEKGAKTLSITTLSIMTLSLKCNSV